MNRENDADDSGCMRTSEQTAPTGVSVVICTYNGASRLPQALAHLAKQETGGEIRWEVIVVDNACTDNSAEVARNCWPAHHEAALRVVSEPRPGLSYAKERGIAEARYELVGFVDDDSWVSPNWVVAAARVCGQHPQAGAVRGIIEAICESGAPRWFAHNRGWFGIWSDLAGPRDVTEVAGGLCGDGMILRKAAWEDLRGKGFRFTLTGNQGTNFNGSEDEELSLALRLAGWRLWYDPGLRLRQVLPAGKLDWSNLRRRARNAGRSSVGLDPYYVALRYLDARKPDFARTLMDRLPAQWMWRTLWSLRALVRRPVAVLAMPFFSMEGNESVLAAEMALSRIGRLLALRGDYDRRMREARAIPWRR